MPNFRSSTSFAHQPSARIHSAEQVTPKRRLVPDTEPTNSTLVPLEASEVFTQIRTGGPVKFLKCQISGALDFAGMHLPEALEFESCTFAGHFNAQSARFGKSLLLRDCSFERSLTLRDAHVGGVLDVSESIVGLPDEVHDAKPGDPILKNRNSHLYEPPPDHRSAKWDGMTVMGSLYAERVTVYGSLNLGDTEVRGSLHLEGCSVGNIDKVTHPKLEGLDFGRLYMRQVRVDGDLEMSVSVTGPTQKPSVQSPSAETERRTHIYSTVSIGSCVILGRLNLRGAQIDGALHAIMANITGRVLADCWVHPDNAKRTIQTYVGVARPFPEHPTSSRAPILADADDDLTRRLSLYFQDTKIGSCVWLRGIWTDGGVDLDNAEIGGSLDLRCWHHPRQVTPESAWTPITDQEALALEKWDTREKSPNSPGPGNPHDDLPQYQTRLGATKSNESLCFRNATIGASLNMEGAITHGRVVGHNSTIRGNLKCVPFEIDNAKVYFRPLIGMNGEGKSLSLYGAKIGGNVEINGARFLGAVRMRYVTLEGALIGQKWQMGRGRSPDVTKQRAGHQKATLRSADILVSPKPGSRRFIRTSIGPQTEIGVSHKAHGLYLYGVKVGGNICCNDIKVVGCVCLKLGKVSGAVELKRSKIAYFDPRLFAAAASWYESLECEPGVSFESARIGGDADFSGAMIGVHFDATNLELGGSLNLGQESTKRITRIGPQRKRSGLWTEQLCQHFFKLNPSEKRWDRLGRICLDLANIKGDIHAHKLHCSGIFLARGVSVAEFELSGDIRIGSEELPGSMPVINLSESRVTGKLRLSDCTVQRNSRHEDDRTLFWPLNMFQARHSSAGRAAIDLRHVHLGALECKSALYESGKPKVKFEDSWIGRRKKRLMEAWLSSKLAKKKEASLDLDGAVFGGLEIEYFFDTDELKHHGTNEFDNRTRITRFVDRHLERLVLAAGRMGNFFTHLDNFKMTMMRAFAGRWRLFQLWTLLGLLTFVGFVWVLALLATGASPGDRASSIQSSVWFFFGKACDALMDAVKHPSRVLHLIEGLSMTAVNIVQLAVKPSEEALAKFHETSQWWLGPTEWPRLWVVFYASALWICLVFFWRSYRIIRPTISPRAKDRGGNFTAFLARMAQYSQGPYDAVRSLLESHGQDDEARRVYLCMRGRELKDGERSWITKLMRWVYHIAAGSGVGVAPLCGFLVLYFCFSWLAVFSNPDSVEHPSTFEPKMVEQLHSGDKNQESSHPQQPGQPVGDHPASDEAKASDDHDDWATRTGRAHGLPWQFRDSEQWPFAPPDPIKTGQPHAEPHPWSYQDGFWMAVKVHVPLIHLWAKEKWEPSTDKGWYYCPMGHLGQTDEGRNLHPHMRPMWWGMEYETYAVIAQIISYLTIPMLITAIGGFYRSQSAATHGHHHSHTHGHAHGQH